MQPVITSSSQLIICAWEEQLQFAKLFNYSSRDSHDRSSNSFIAMSSVHHYTRQFYVITCWRVESAPAPMAMAIMVKLQHDLQMLVNGFCMLSLCRGL